MTNPSPAITFTVDLTLSMTEKIGPITSVRTTGVLSPDRHTTDQDNAVETIGDRRNHLSALLPMITIGDRSLKHGDVFTEYGMNAVYIRNMYGIGLAPTERAYLTYSVA